MNGKPQVLASYDASSNQTQILLGGANEAEFNTTLNLEALQDKYPNGAHVTVYATDFTAPADMDNVAESVPAASDGRYIVVDAGSCHRRWPCQFGTEQPQRRQRLLRRRHACHGPGAVAKDPVEANTPVATAPPQ